MGYGDADGVDGSMTEASDKATSALCQLAIDYWRLLRAYDRLREKAEDGHAARFAAHSKFALGRLEASLGDAGLRLALFDGQEFHAGLPVRPLNADDFETDDETFVAYTNEPTILCDAKVVVLGTVTLEKRLKGAD